VIQPRCPAFPEVSVSMRRVEIGTCSGVVITASRGGVKPPVVISEIEPNEVVLYHSTVVEGSNPVHHNNPVCWIGGKTSIRDIRLGDAGRPLCDECALLWPAPKLRIDAVLTTIASGPSG
jgi:hypothetical protein